VATALFGLVLVYAELWPLVALTGVTLAHYGRICWQASQEHHDVRVLWRQLVIGSLVSIACAALLTGGLNSPVLYWILATPILSAHEQAHVQINTAMKVAMGMLVAITFVQVAGLLPASILPPELHEVYNGCSVFGALAAAFIALRHYDTERRAFHDEVVRRLKAEERARAQAETAAAVRGRFLSTMSHELRTPMNGVLGMVQLLLDSPLSPEQRSQLQAVMRSGRSLLTILNEVLDFSKLEAQGEMVAPEPFDLHVLIEDVSELFAPMAHARGLRMHIDIAEEVPATLTADPHRTRQILSNLLGNAVKFTEAGRITVIVRVQGDHLRVVVQDTGVGVPEKARSRLFQAYSQVDANAERRAEGTGLGLAISRKLAERMGGQMGFEPAHPQGSAFWFTLPLVDPGPIVEAPVLAGRTLLVLEGDDDDARVLERYLRAAGALPMRFRGEAELAHAGLRLESVDAVLLSDVLANGSTAAISNHLRAAHPYLPVITLSPLGSQSVGTPFGENLRRPLWKPLRRAELIHTLVTLLEPRPVEELAAPVVSQLHVLLADDNFVNQRVIATMLQRMGCEVTVVGNGAEAITASSRAEFGLILMDLNMPEIDGAEAARRIRDREGGWRHTPIVSLTASLRDEDIEACFTAGMDDMLSKPVDQAELRILVARMGAASVPATVEPPDPAELMPLFAEDARGVHSELLAAVATQDRQRASRAVHQLRSCAAMIGAQALSQQAATLERRWLDAPGADVEEEVVIRLLADVESIFSNNGPSAGARSGRLGSQGAPMSSPHNARLQILHPEVERYVDGLGASEDALLDSLEALALERGFPLIGRSAGRWLRRLTRMIGGRRVFELGSGFGFSAWYFAQAVGPTGAVIGTEHDAHELIHFERLWAGHPLRSRGGLRQGDAISLLAETEGEFDVIFFDLHKIAYPEALEAAVPRLRKGGLLLADNVLWGGRVTQPAPPDDESTEALRRFNEAIHADPRLDAGILPTGDGLAVCLRVAT